MGGWIYTRKGSVKKFESENWLKNIIVKGKNQSRISVLLIDDKRETKEKSSNMLNIRGIILKVLLSLLRLKIWLFCLCIRDPCNLSFFRNEEFVIIHSKKMSSTSKRKTSETR